MPAPTWRGARGFRRNRKSPRCARGTAGGGCPHTFLLVQLLTLHHQSIAKNFTHTGDATSSTWPVGVSFPVFGSILKITMLSDF